MNSADYVDALVIRWKDEGKDPAWIVWNAALACEGWAYVFGAWGAYCTVSERKKRYSDAHPTIKTKCKAFDGGTCTGCQWYPDGKRTRCFDCRGFTDWCLLRVGVDLIGEGATSQWNTSANWESKGTIDTMPADRLVCLFVKNGSKMSHTGFGYNNETVECSSGVQHFTSRNKKWTHWALPAGLYNGVQPEPIPPAPEPEPEKGTAVVVGGALNMRQGPDKSCKIVTQIQNGKTVQLMDLPDGWTYVGYNNKQGFVMDDYIRKG